jgi:hypothetical protein
MKTTTQKQGTRGQAQIFRENRETIRNYSLASAIASAIYLLVHLLLIEHTAWSAWSAFMVSGGLELLAVVLMKSSAKSLKGEKGQIIDAGVDLNSEHSFGE